MSSDAEQLAAIRSQALANLASITAQPKPTYVVDGQNVAWGQYLSQLQATVDWCTQKLAEAEPFELQSQAETCG
jgi:hypothetical protein